MKVTSNNFLKSFSLAIFIAFSTLQFAHADTEFSGKKLAFSMPEIVRDVAKSISLPTDEVVATTSPEQAIKDRNTCEHFDATLVNTLNLELASSDAKQKIEKVEETIEDESFYRDTILGNIKNFLGLQKKDKVIFREMKKEIVDAKNYYSDIDEKVASTSSYLEDNVCENLKLVDAEKLDIDTQNLVDDESTFRKQFVSSLKDKIKILQESVKSAKK